jgi:hypothetical protein
VYDEPSQPVQLPNGETLEANLFVREDLELAGKIYPDHKLHVIKMKPGLIIGCDFLNSQKVYLDFEHHRVRLQHGTDRVTLTGKA